jgi:hypothetical protein
VLLAPNLKNQNKCKKKISQQNKTKNETNSDNTCTYSLLKNTQKTRDMKKKNIKRKKVRK